MDDKIAQAFDPEEFRRQGHELIDLLADHLQETLHPKENEQVLHYVPPNHLYKEWEERLERDSSNMTLTELFKRLRQDVIKLHHPKYLGHQTSVVAPPAALAELFGAILDPGMGVYEHGTTGVVLERLLTKKMGLLLGWDYDTCEGFFTNGGTLANLSCLLCARQVMVENRDIWYNGYENQQYGFLVSSEAHYSVAKAVQVMGMGHQGVVTVPVDEQFRMRIDLLPHCYQTARENGIIVLGVIASSCSTATGSHDNIEAISAFCRIRKLWLHVDGAHGGCAMFSKRHRNLLHGIEHADSFSVDFHKMLLTPTLTTAVIFRNGDHSYQTFSQKASYLWEQDEDKEWYHLGKRTFELTKSFVSVRVYALWHLFGTNLFEQNVDRLYALGQTFTTILSDAPDFHPLLPNPETNVVCFRFVPHEENLANEDIERVNAEIRKRLTYKGSYSMVQTRVGGKFYLRCCFMNPFTTEKEMVGLLESVRDLYREISAKEARLSS